MASLGLLPYFVLAVTARETILSDLKPGELSSVLVSLVWPGGWKCVGFWFVGLQPKTEAFEHLGTASPRCIRTRRAAAKLARMGDLRLGAERPCTILPRAART